MEVQVGHGEPMFNSYGAGNELKFAVRPIVFLQSNVTEAEVPITTGSEVDWDTTPGTP